MADGQGALERVHSRALFQSLTEPLERYSTSASQVTIHVGAP